MDARLLREFVTRPRDEVEAAKVAHWARAFREGGATTTLAAGHALHAHARAASAEDLIVMKVLAGRPKDVEDVVAIVAAKGEHLDGAQVRETLRMLEEALDRSDLVPVFEDARRRAGMR